MCRISALLPLASKRELRDYTVTNRTSPEGYTDRKVAGNPSSIGGLEGELRDYTVTNRTSPEGFTDAQVAGNPSSIGGLGRGVTGLY